MKTPYEIEATIKQLEEGDFDKNIIHFCKNTNKLKMLFEYLCEYEKIIKIKVEPNKINFHFLYCLDILITYDKVFNNFIYSQNFISYANEYINIKPKNERKIIIDLKILYDLIDNYIKAYEDLDYNLEPISDELEKIKNKVEKNYVDIFNKRKDIVKLFDLTDNINSVNVKTIYSKILINLFEESKFEDFDYVNEILESLEVDSNYVDSETIEQIKALINSINFQNAFRLTRDNYDDPKIINLLYFLLVYILNGPSDLQNFPFLSKSKKLYDELFDSIDSKKLLLNLPVGLRKRLEKVIEFFKTNEKYFTESFDLKTRVNNQSSIRVKIVKKKKNKDKIRRERLSKILSSNFNKYKIKKTEERFEYDLNATKLFNTYNFYSNDKNSKNLDDYTNNVEYFLENDDSTSFHEYLLRDSTKLISKKYIFKDNDEI